MLMVLMATGALSRGCCAGRSSDGVAMLLVLPLREVVSVW